MNDIFIAMEKLNYPTYRGKVYKKERRAKYTFSYRCEARTFVNTLATNELFKPRLIREMKRVVELLADPFCKLFSPLSIDYDLIEVNQGVCWSLKGRSFAKDAIQEQEGKQCTETACKISEQQESENPDLEPEGNSGVPYSEETASSEILLQGNGLCCHCNGENVYESALDVLGMMVKGFVRYVHIKFLLIVNT